MNATLGFAIVGALARLLRPLGLGPLAGPDPEVEGETAPYTGLVTHEHGLPNGSGLWHRHALLELHAFMFEAAHPGQDPDSAP